MPPQKEEPTNLSIIFGKNLRRIRIGLDKSQDEFADQVGLHRTYLGAIERGERNVTLSVLQRVAAALSVPPISLLEDHET